MIDRHHELSNARQAKLVGISRSSVAARSVLESCAAYTSVSQLAVDVSVLFVQYTLSVEDARTARKTLTVTGGSLLIDRDTLGVIVRTAASADRTIANIKLHGQVVRFQGGGPVIGVSVEVLAETIYIEDGSASLMLLEKTSQTTLAARIRCSQPGCQHT